MSLATIDHNLPSVGGASLPDTLAVWRDAADLAKAIARTEFVPKALMNKPESVMACILRGYEVGIGPLQALSSIHVIEGRPALSAELDRALVLSKGHEIWFDELNNTRATICGRRAGSDHVSTVTWTLDDAKKAGLAGKQNWQRYPRAMLAARATGELCRLIFADVLGGISYTVEELQDGDVIDVEPVADDAPEGEAAKPITRKAAPAKKAAKKPAAPREPVAEAPAPALPGDDEDGTGEPEEVVVRRAQQIAMRANAAGVDHHHVVSAVTNGQKTSAKAVTGEEAAEVLQALHEIKAGRLRLAEDDGGFDLVPAEQDGSDDEDLPNDGEDDPASRAEAQSGWSVDEWKRFLSDSGLRQSDLIREAQRIANERKLDVPTSLSDVAGMADIASDLAAWVEEKRF